MLPKTAFASLSGILALLLLVGCSLRRPLTYHAVEYNRVVEAVHNRTLLLNIVRAQNRLPMHFTSIGNITADLSYTASSGSLSLEDASGRESDGSVTRTNSDKASLGLPTLSVTANPTATVAVLDTQEFVRGTLAPVKAETVRYYLTQGWKPDLLAYLLVERIELSCELARYLHDPKADRDDEGKCDPTGLETMLENDPEDGEEFEVFRGFVDHLARYHCTFEGIPGDKLLGHGPEPTIKNIIKAHEAGLRIKEPIDQDAEGDNTDKTKSGGSPGDGKPAPAQYRVVQEKSRLKLQCAKEEEDEKEEDQEEDKEAAPGGGDGEGGKRGKPEVPSRMTGQVLDETDEPRDGRVDEEEGDGEKYTFQLVLRSPQGVLYYLGEVMRVWDRAMGQPEGIRKIPLIRTSAEKDFASQIVSYGGHAWTPLFTARASSKGCREGRVEVGYDGGSYIIPKAPRDAESCETGCCTGRSMQALTLVSQLLSLQKKGESLPGVSLVRSIGQ